VIRRSGTTIMPTEMSVLIVAIDITPSKPACAAAMASSLTALTAKAMVRAGP
jgi:hypothetical protein